VSARDEILGRTKADLGFGATPEQREAMMRQVDAQGAVRDFEGLTMTDRPAEDHG